MTTKVLKSELPDFVTAKLPEFFISYPKINGVRPSSWIQWTNEGNILVETLRPCHMSLIFNGPGWDHLITAVPKSSKNELLYQNMLINGPFKAYSDLITLSSLDKNYYIHCSNLSQWPANVLYNYCISTRVPIEKQPLLDRWYALLEKEYDPTLAFLLAYSTPGDPRLFPALGHFWFDSNADWSNILKGKMVKCSTPFKTSPEQCTPSNVIWGTSKDYLKLKAMSDEEVAEYFGFKITKPKVEKLKSGPEPIPQAAGNWQMALGQQINEVNNIDWDN